MNKPDISVIIRTLNEERYLPELLQNIKNQKTYYSYEVVLIDSGSTDRTLKIAEEFGCRILHIRREEFSFGRSLNRACREAYGKYFVFISGHCIPRDNMWMDKLVEPLAQEIAAYAYGRQIGGAYTYWSEAQIFNKYFPPESQIPQAGFYCNNANSTIRRKTWLQYQFDEELTGLEDMHLAKRIVSSGGKIAYTAEACVYHLHNEHWQQIQRRFEREALALQKICPEVVVRRRDILGYFLRAVITDVSTSKPGMLGIRHIYKIILYRYFQYSGSYKGNHTQKILNKQLRDSYFYPTPSKGQPLTSKRT